MQVDETAHLQRSGVATTDDSAKYTWDHTPSGKVLAVFTYDGFVDEVKAGGEAPVGVVLDRTGFYAEAGGQVADTGRLLLPDGQEMEVSARRADALADLAQGEGWPPLPAVILA
jgi:alanyl-tRNA synthetase